MHSPQADLRELCEDTHGRRVLLHLLRSDGVSKLAPAAREVLQPPPKARQAAPSEGAAPAKPSAAADADEDGDEGEDAPEQVRRSSDRVQA